MSTNVISQELRNDIDKIPKIKSKFKHDKVGHYRRDLGEKISIMTNEFRTEATRRLCSQQWKELRREAKYSYKILSESKTFLLFYWGS